MRFHILFSLFFIQLVLMAQDKESDAIYLQGKTYYEQKDFPKAINSYESALKLSPNNDNIRYELTQVYMEIGDYTSAIQHYNKMIRTDGLRMLDAFFMKGQAQYLLGQRKKAIKTYRQAIDVFPNDPLLYYNLARYEHEEHEYDAAELHLTEAIYLDKNHPSSHLLMAYIAISKKERVKAMLSLYYFLLLEPNSERAATAFQILLRLQKENISQQHYADIELKNEENQQDDFQIADMLISFLLVSQQEKLTSQSDSEAFVIRNEIFFKTLSELMNDKNSFWWNTYVSFFRNMSELGYTEAYSYHISQTELNTEKIEWIKENANAVGKFYTWLKPT